MAYNFGILNFGAANKARYWKKGPEGQSYENGKPPVDYAVDNNWQDYGDNLPGTGAIPTFKPINSANQFEITAGHAVVDNAFSILPLTAPVTPTITFSGTAGSTTYTYRVVGRAGSLQAPSATASVTTANATLSGLNYNIITFTPQPGFTQYDIYRTVGGATQGMIGSAVMALGPNVLTPRQTFLDTGLRADGSTAPTANSTGALVGDLVVYGNVTYSPLATPATPLVTPQGTVGSTSYSYKIVAKTASGHTAASSAGTTTTGNATLTATNSNLITWQPVVGAVSYDVYRSATGGTPSSVGLIGNTIFRTFTDTGLVGDTTTAPTTNTTGQVTTGGSSSPSQAVTSNYIATESGANNAIAGTLTGLTPVAGTVVTIQLAHTLQAGANTFALNGGSATAIKSSKNVANNIGTAYAATGVIVLFFNGTSWLDLSQ